MKESDRMSSTSLRYRTHSHLFAMTRIIFSACVVAVLLIASNIVYGNVPWTDHVPGYVVVGSIVALFFWGSERIWRTAVMPMRKNPFGWFDLATQLPFWYFAGALGYTLGLIVTKKIGLLIVFDVPIKPFFLFGGLCGTIFQIIMFFAETKFQRKYNFSHDESRTT